MTTIFAADSRPTLQRHWDIRAAGNFIGGGTGSGLIIGAAIAGQNFAPALFVGLVFVALGLGMVFLEIGRPWRTLNVFLHPQTSWMTREGVMALPLLGFGGLALLVHWGGGPVSAVSALKIVTGISACGFLYCQARILRAAKGIPAWREPALTPFMLSTGLTEGMGVLSIFAAFGLAPSWVIAAALGLALLRAAAWQRYNSNMERAKAPVASLDALRRIALPFLLVGTGVPVLSFAVAMLRPEFAAAAAFGGLFLTASGWWTKLTIMTKAAATRGMAIPRAPVRGGSAVRTDS